MVAGANSCNGNNGDMWLQKQTVRLRSLLRSCNGKKLEFSWSQEQTPATAKTAIGGRRSKPFDFALNGTPATAKTAIGRCRSKHLYE